MGLDGVELIMAVEESFGIEFRDEEAGKIITVGDFYKLILTKLHETSDSRCLTSAAFYRIRRGLKEGLGIVRRSITPGTVLGSVIPLHGRKNSWQRVQGATRIELPDLERPRWVWISLASFAVVLLAALVPLLYVFNLRFGPGSNMIWLSLFMVVVLIALSVRLSRPLATEFPHSAITVGDLARDALSRNYAQLAAAAGGSNKSEVWETLCRVIVNQTGVDREKVKPDARIVKDLGLD